MNKLREKFKNAFPYSPSIHFDECEQITDDFTIAFAIWLTNAKPSNIDLKIDYTQKDEIVATELLTYFKENVYNK